MNIPLQSELNIGVIGHVDHGKTALTRMLTGKWADTHSEEIKRGISIRLGYADIVFKKIPNANGFEAYTTENEVNGKETKPIKRISFVDSPGHESLMATMLSGVAIINCAILVVAANEKCPQPRTMEHLLAAKYSNIKDLIVVQNKIDLVSKEDAKENYEQIKKFLLDLGYTNVPIIPVSANQGINKDVLIYAICKYFNPKPLEKNDDMRMYVVRSFDVNKPGTQIKDLIGGVIGGSIISGKLKIGDKIDISMGNKILNADVLSLNTEFGIIKEAGQGGLIAIGTSLDPAITQNDKLKGQMVAMHNKLPKPSMDITLDLHIVEKLLNEDLKKPLLINEAIIIIIGTGTAIGSVSSVNKNIVKFNMRSPIVALKNQKVSLSRKSSNGWRLYGYGIIS